MCPVYDETAEKESVKRIEMFCYFYFFEILFSRVDTALQTMTILCEAGYEFLDRNRLRGLDGSLSSCWNSVMTFFFHRDLQFWKQRKRAWSQMRRTWQVVERYDGFPGQELAQNRGFV